MKEQGFEFTTLKVGKKSKKSSKSNSRKSGKGASPYDAPNEYGRASNCFKTSRAPYSKIISFPEVLTVESPKQHLRDVRDTFRSKVNVRLVYLKVNV